MQPRRKEFTQHTVLQFQLFSGACCFCASSTRNPLNQNFIEGNNILQLPFSPSLSSSPYHCLHTFCTLPPLSPLQLLLCTLALLISHFCFTANGLPHLSLLCWHHPTSSSVPHHSWSRKTCRALSHTTTQL